MTTPICDFVRAYAGQNTIRMHMPGHKGCGLQESLDITEIPGADVLYASDGVIRQSEENAAGIFGSARTVYSTEGSSLCIRAMLYLSLLYAKRRGRRPKIAAGRNAHRVFTEAAALLDPEVMWIGGGNTLLSCEIHPDELEALFSDSSSPPTAVYVTSPDYLGNRTDLADIAELCHQNGALLLVDNAHGAYLRFLREPLHPLGLGADLCCDSAHKTLPVLTGGAYLHASDCCPKELLTMMERAMALFASTSPSYLILQSLDAVNPILEKTSFRRKLDEVCGTLRYMKSALEQRGWDLAGDEPMKLALRTKKMGYLGTELAGLLEAHGIVCEFADPDYLVMMPGPETPLHDLALIQSFLMMLPARSRIEEYPPQREMTEPVLSIREAILSPAECVPVEESLGRILASPSVNCPPAVPICVCGERIDREAVALFRYYGIRSCDVVIE